MNPETTPIRVSVNHATRVLGVNPEPGVGCPLGVNCERRAAER